MKSIREKVKEAQIGYDDIQAPAIGRGFILGANYVLEQVERLLNSQRFVDGPSKELFELIEQLKK